MSSSSLFNLNDYNIYCNEMHCKNMIPSGTGNQGDILTVDNTGKSVFSKTINGTGPTAPIQFKNAPVEILSDNGLAPAILAIGTDLINDQPAILGMGNLATQDSFFFAYNGTSNSLSLGQNNAATDHDFTTELNNGHLVVNNKLKLPTIAANNLLKTDGSNVVIAATTADVPNLYSANGTITDATRTIDGNGADLNFDNISILTNNVGRNLINANNRVEINTPTLILNQLTNGFLQTDNSGNVTATTLNNNLVSVVNNNIPGSYNITVPANAITAKISAVGSGGAGANPSGGQGGGGGGAGGAIIDFPIGVKAGQTITIVVGAGGATPGTNGTNTTINLGTFTITCSGGQGGQLAVPSGNGGNGGSVILPFATTSGGLGGIAGVGANGNVGMFAYSGAGGGAGANGGPTFSGGAQLLSTGGTGNGRQGGGGASAFANGGSYNVAPGGTLGSGGPGDVNNIFTGGNGFVSISFYSS